MDSKNEFTITRVFDAPLKLVWEAHTEPAHLMKWWGPKELKMASAKVDLRPGGLFHYSMEAPDGTRMWGKFVYREIVPEKKLAFIVSFSDEMGGTSRHPMAQNWPLEMLNTVLFTEENGKTRITASAKAINASEEECMMFDNSHPSMDAGFNGTYDNLDTYLKTLPTQAA